MKAALLTLIATYALSAALGSPGAVALSVTPVPTHGVARVHGQPRANAVVWLTGGPDTATADAPQPVMDQRTLQFFPQVLAVRVGTTVKFPNSDRVFHNVFSFRDGKLFDLGLYPVGAVKYVHFDRPGVSRLFCNIHPKMAAYVVAVDSPYFATTDEHGAFELNPPPGTYTYNAWRAGADLLTGAVTVSADRPLVVDWP